MKTFYASPENHTLSLHYGTSYVLRVYDPSDSVWRLPPEKQERKLIADLQRELACQADELSAIQVVTRG